MNMIIDSLALKAEEPQDLTLYLEESIDPHIRKVALKSVTILHSVEMAKLFQNSCTRGFASKNIYIHCDILDRDTNYFNNKKSDILAHISYYRIAVTKKCAVFNFKNCLYKNLKSSDFTSIRLYLAGCDGSPLSLGELGGNIGLIYELEFI